MILNFTNYLSEASLYEVYLMEAEKKAKISNDDKGKLHELLLAAHLHPETTDKNLRLPSHFRAEGEEAKAAGHAGSPQFVHDKLRKKVGEEAYQQIYAHAKQTAGEVKKTLQEQGHLDKNTMIGDVHWTSNRDRENKAGDHQNLVKQKDTNSNADLIVSVHRKNKDGTRGDLVSYHGISAKYGTNKDPNYKNPGTDSLEKMAGLREGRISEIMAPHHQFMEHLGYSGTIDERHAQYKMQKMPINESKEMLATLKNKVKKGEQLTSEEMAMHTHLPSFINMHDSQPTAKAKKEFLDNERSIADKADESKRKHLGLVSKELTNSLIEKTKDDGKGSADAALRKQIMGDVSPKTIIPHLVAQSHVQEDGSVNSIVHDSADIAKNHLDKYERLHVATDRTGAVVIRGYEKGAPAGEKPHTVATYGLKTQSGPHKNINGTLTGISG